MSNNDKIEEYEEMAAAFQCSQIQILDQTLKESGIEEDKRKEIVETFTLRFSVFLDQYWFESEKGNVHPIIAFSRKYQDSNPANYHFNQGTFSFTE